MEGKELYSLAGLLALNEILPDLLKTSLYIFTIYFLLSSEVNKSLGEVIGFTGWVGFALYIKYENALNCPVLAAPRREIHFNYKTACSESVFSLDSSSRNTVFI